MERTVQTQEHLFSLSHINLCLNNISQLFIGNKFNTTRYHYDLSHLQQCSIYFKLKIDNSSWCCFDPCAKHLPLSRLICQRRHHCLFTSDPSVNQLTVATRDAYSSSSPFCAAVPIQNKTSSFEFSVQVGRLILEITQQTAWRVAPTGDFRPQTLTDRSSLDGESSQYKTECTESQRQLQADRLNSTLILHKYVKNGGLHQESRCNAGVHGSTSDDIIR